MHLNALQNRFQPSACRVHISTHFDGVRVAMRHLRA